jgi:hypothetical protein
LCAYDDSRYDRDYYSYTDTEDGYTVNDDSLDEIYFSDMDNCYYLYEENMPKEEYTRSYHNSTSQYVPSYSPNFGEFSIGFEAEKEDLDVKTSEYISDFERKCQYWRKENDSSLDEDSGFELISPIFPLDADYIKSHIMGNDVLLNHINANTSLSCGGHMTVSKLGTSADKLFDSISGYVPIFFSMYWGRIKNDYCLSADKQTLKHTSSRRAIYLKHDRIEFRLFSAIKNLNQLEFRLKLMQYIFNNPTEDYDTARKNIIKERNLFPYTKEKFNFMITRSKVYAIDYKFSVNSEQIEDELESELV